jgi:hypothetical protein
LNWNPHTYPSIWERKMDLSPTCALLSSCTCLLVVHKPTKTQASADVVEGEEP